MLIRLPFSQGGPGEVPDAAADGISPIPLGERGVKPDEVVYREFQASSHALHCLQLPEDLMVLSHLSCTCTHMLLH
jgi:hypothetical protein